MPGRIAIPSMGYALDVSDPGSFSGEIAYEKVGNPLLKAKGVERPPNHLFKVWRFVRWLDRARWCAMSGLIPGPVFARLEPDQKLLTHWLCYITDQQRPYQQVWENGGPIFAEIVRTYTETRHPPLDVLKEFTEPSEQSSGVDRFSTKLQRNQGELVVFTPRFGMHLLSIASTVTLLEDCERSLVKYLGKHWDFCLPTKGVQREEAARRMAFLLYLLSYWEITRGLGSLRRTAFQRAVDGRTKKVGQILGRRDSLEGEYRYWLTHAERYHKRLWAALRDYLKPGSHSREYLHEAFRAINRTDIVEFIRSNEAELLRGLEVPGDIWNLRFFHRVFGPEVGPQSFRQWYEAAVRAGVLAEGSYVEQFDVSFDYSPYMCDERAYETCLFRRESRIRKLCIPLNGLAWEGKQCPVAAYLCGYEYPCNPSGCPVREQSPKDLCSGCMLTIKTR